MNPTPNQKGGETETVGNVNFDGMTHRKGRRED